MDAVGRPGCPVAGCPVARVLDAGAVALGEPELARAAARLAAPVRVGVRGRPGAGTTTVARALRAGGVAAAEPARARVPELCEVEVYVFVETLTAEDRAALAAVGGPCVAVLAKADLAGFGGGGPMAAGRARCPGLSAAGGVPVHPLAALPAACWMDGELAGALVALAAGRTSAPAASDRLLAELDLFGIATAVTALRAGVPAAGIPAVLRRAGGLDAVTAAIHRAGAPARYRRAVTVLAELAGAAAGPSGRVIADFLAGDDVVLARAAAAADVVRAAGRAVPAGTDRDVHLSQAIAWQRYARGPVSRLHRDCGVDLARAALRRFSAASGRASGLAP